MGEYLTRFWDEIAARPDGPLAFRFYLQPAMALFFAFKDGLRDARFGAPPYFWRLFTHPGERRELLHEGWQSVGRVFLLALVMDLAYQLFVMRAFRPLEGLFVSAVLALLPYMLLRGPINRIASGFRRVRVH